MNKIIFKNNNEKIILNISNLKVELYETILETGFYSYYHEFICNDNNIIKLFNNIEKYSEFSINNIIYYNPDICQIYKNRYKLYYEQTN